MFRVLFYLWIFSFIVFVFFLFSFSISIYMYLLQYIYINFKIFIIPYLSHFMFHISSYFMSIPCLFIYTYLQYTHTDLKMQVDGDADRLCHRGEGGQGAAWGGCDYLCFIHLFLLILDIVLLVLLLIFICVRIFFLLLTCF